MTMSDLIFKAFEPFRDVIEEVSDERGTGDGIWVYPIRATEAAEGICSPSQLHEDTVKQLVAQLRDVAAEIRANPNPPTCKCGHAIDWHEDECKAACTLCSCGAVEKIARCARCHDFLGDTPHRCPYTNLSPTGCTW
jgi:hypothetical protein